MQTLRGLGAAIVIAALAAFAPADAAEGPGSVVSSKPEAGAPPGTKAWRVIYRSTGLKNEPIEVSGMVIVPQLPAPGGRPILAWAHPTSGLVDKCAPSLSSMRFLQIAGLADMLARGYIVAATDYPGLGMPGIHPYLVGVSEGRAVLDSIRAAAEVTGETNVNAALWGHSQGGHAALFAAQIAPQYAPEINIKGVAAAAPATELAKLLAEDEPTPNGKTLLAMTLWSWARVFGAPIDKVVEPTAIPVIDALAQDCLETMSDIAPRTAIGKELQQRFLRDEALANEEPWKSLMAQNTVGLPPKAIPILLVQGTKDDTVHQDVTRDYARKLCAHGSHMVLELLPNVGHGVVAMEGAHKAIEWIADRFAGKAAPTSCAPG